MNWKILIAHANGEETYAERLAQPIREAGYEVAHQGTVLVGESVVEEASKILALGGPVILCSTVKAMGTRWARRLVNAAQRHSGVRVFAVQMEEEADVESLTFDSLIARYWQDPNRAVQELLESLGRYYPLKEAEASAVLGSSAEQRYRELLLETCDILSLANLPEQDRNLVQRQLELRRLYVPLRAWVEAQAGEEEDETRWEALEKRRLLRMKDIPGGDQPARERQRVPVGERLAEARRLVVLGDPGAGKTTLTRWIATAYLLRLKRDPDVRDLPDVKTLPDQDWLPIIVRCRDLDERCLSGSLEDMLDHTLRKAELSGLEAAALRQALRQRLHAGQALLMLDGLDEIADSAVRARFCQQIERVHLAHPAAPILATSRIVGYREMGYRLGRGFEHLTLADLEKEEKDDFARRWCALTELPERRIDAARDLIHDIHSMDRIERLTGNPMLLTTLALVKRKVGKLPTRRADLYWEAVQVLLNWRREVDQPLDPHEAIPQLEYVGYAMCERGVQQLRKDEILELIDRMRQEYPNVHPARNRTPEEFLRRLEARTGLLVEAGHTRHLGMDVPVYEFRHLTFQEYLAARALVDGRFPGRDPYRSLAEHVAPLAGRTAETAYTAHGPKEIAVIESWREPLRLCIATCLDKDVDSLLRAILAPLEGEPESNARARAIMAALCLADEPNAGEAVAGEVLQGFARQIKERDGVGSIGTGVDAAAMELAGTRWKEELCSILVQDFKHRRGDIRIALGSLASTVGSSDAPEDSNNLNTWLREQTERIRRGSPLEAIQSALNIMDLAFRKKALMVPDLVEGLLDMLTGTQAMALAAAWALGWLGGGVRDEKPLWEPTEKDIEPISNYIGNVNADPDAIRFLTWILRGEKAEAAVEPLLARLEDAKARVRQAAVQALGRIGSQRAVEPLVARLHDPEEGMRRTAAEALGRIGGERAVEPLLARLEDPEEGMRRTAAEALGRIGGERAVEPLLARLEHPQAEVRQAAAEALGRIGERAVEPLLARLEDPEEGVRQAAVQALGRIGSQRAVEPLLARLEDKNEEVRREGLHALSLQLEENDRRLLSRDLDGEWPFLDPQEEIGETFLQEAARELELTAEEVRAHYEALAERFHLRLAWKRSQ